MNGCLNRGYDDTHLQVTADIAQQWNITDAGDEKKPKRAKEDDNGEESRHRQHGRRHGVPGKILGNIPFCGVVLRQPYGIERESVDGLSRAVCQQNTLPACGLRLARANDHRYDKNPDS